MNLIQWLWRFLSKENPKPLRLCYYSLTHKKPSKLKSNLPKMTKIFLNAIFVMTFLSVSIKSCSQKAHIKIFLLCVWCIFEFLSSQQFFSLLIMVLAWHLRSFKKSQIPGPQSQRLQLSRCEVRPMNLCFKAPLSRESLNTFLGFGCPELCYAHSCPGLMFNQGGNAPIVLLS